jgi:adenylosuccinate lyase
MGARIADSALYGHLWGTDELRAIFSEEARIRDWIWILVRLAEAQAEVGIIPRNAAAAIAHWSAEGRLDLAHVARATRETGHSTLGLIRGLQGGPAPRGRRMGLLRRHGAGPHRHLDRDRHATRRRGRVA